MNIITKSFVIDEIASLIGYSVPVVFETMFRLSAHALPVGELSRLDQGIAVGSVGFTGETNGMVYIQVPAGFARKLASQMLSLPAAELDDEMINDVIGELSNVVVGAVKSQLCDSGSPCHLTIPTIIRGNALSIKPLSSEDRHALYFVCGDDTFLITILMKQPNSGDNKL